MATPGTVLRGVPVLSNDDLAPLAFRIRPGARLGVEPKDVREALHPTDPLRGPSGVISGNKILDTKVETWADRIRLCGRILRVWRALMLIGVVAATLWGFGWGKVPAMITVVVACMAFLVMLYLDWRIQLWWRRSWELLFNSVADSATVLDWNRLFVALAVHMAGNPVHPREQALKPLEGTNKGENDIKDDWIDRVMKVWVPKLHYERRDGRVTVTDPAAGLSNIGLQRSVEEWADALNKRFYPLYKELMDADIAVLWWVSFLSAFVAVVACVM
jgi:hypothetical protein